MVFTKLIDRVRYALLIVFAPNQAKTVIHLQFNGTVISPPSDGSPVLTVTSNHKDYAEIYYDNLIVRSPNFKKIDLEIEPKKRELSKHQKEVLDYMYHQK